jgi:streptomycin 6-kinase
VADATPPWVDPAWLAALPDLRERCAVRWHLSIGERLGAGKTSRVYGCMDDRGNPRVLKLAPGEMRPDLEAAALALWDGRGAPRLLDFDAASGALLLVRLVPGTPLPGGDDAAAVERVAPALTALHAARVPTPGAFPTQLAFLDTWSNWVRSSAEEGTAGLRLFDVALRLARALCATAADPVLLHGDYIDKNLLLDGSDYVAVDPIPRIGDRASDVGAFSAYHPPATGTARRARQLAERCGVDQDRAARWAAVWAVGEATETWRADSDELQDWVTGAEAAELLAD